MIVQNEVNSIKYEGPRRGVNGHRIRDILFEKSIQLLRRSIEESVIYLQPKPAPQSNS